MKSIRYLVKERMLFVIANDKHILLGRTIRVVRKLRRVGDAPMVELKFDEETGNDRTIQIPFDHAQNGTLLRTLAANGYLLPEDRDKQSHIAKYVISKLVDARTVTIPGTNGWYCDESGTTPKWHFLLRQPVITAPTAGTVETFKREVASLLTGNPYLIFMCAAAFASPLVILTEDASPIFAVVGDSGTGKSTATNLARSIFFPRELRASWDGTEQGLAAFVREFNHCVVELDEIGSGDPATTFHVIYRISNGTGRLRSNTNGNAIALPPYRGTLIASGEHSLFEASRQAKKMYPEGFDARWVGLPVDDAHPMFPNLHGESSAAAFAERLTEATTRNYGAVGLKWTNMLAKMRTADNDLGRKEYAIQCQLVRQAVASDRKPRQFDRVAKHFALVAAGGEMAIAAGLLPLNQGDASEAAIYALSAWAEAKLGFEMDPDARLLHTFRKWYTELDAAERIQKFTRDAYLAKDTVTAFRHRHKTLGHCLLLRPESLRRKFGSQLSQYVRALKDGGYLATGPRGTPTKQFAIPDSPSYGTPSFYAIHRSFFSEA